MSYDYSHRKSQKTIKVILEDGTPAINKTVNVKLSNPEFLFGAAFFDVIPYAAGKLEGEKKELCERNLEKFLSVFNNSTLPFYWGRYEREEGKPSFEDTMSGAKFLQDHGFKVKGHPLCWHTVCADWLLKYSTEDILKLQLERINREVSSYKGVIDMWDVINEVVIMPIFDKYDNAVTRLCNKYGRVGLVKMVFEEAKKANPDSTLLINDFNLTTNYEILIDGALEAGAKIDTIGIQSHQHQGYMGSEKLYEILKRFGHFGKPIHFTENTLTSGHLMPPEVEDLNDYQIPSWPSTPEYEERQANDTEEMYRILFSDPNVEAAVSWNFSDSGAWLGAPAGWIRKDGSEKPVYTRMKDIIKNEWSTAYVTHTNENGEIILEGFRGDYDLSILGKDYQVSLRKEDLNKAAEISLK